jgi:hypothetical protein
MHKRGREQEENSSSESETQRRDRGEELLVRLVKVFDEVYKVKEGWWA